MLLGGAAAAGLQGWQWYEAGEWGLLAGAAGVGAVGIPAAGALAVDGDVTYLDVGSAQGSGTWRALVLAVPGSIEVPESIPDGFVGGFPATDREGQVTVVAVRTAGLDASLRRLVQIEATATLVVLAAIGVGTWLLLRRGLRPL